METVTRLCLSCQSDLSGAHPNRKYCSLPCKERYYWRRANPYPSGRSCAWCLADMEGTRAHAVYCSRVCKSKAAQERLRKGNPAEKARDRARYAREAKSRRQHAKRQYWANREAKILYSRAWRKANPDRRQVQGENRRGRKLGNPGYVRVTIADWLNIRNRFAGCCAYCGLRPDKLFMDHVVPLARGGRHAPSNILPACPDCNSAKAALFLSEWRYRT